MQPVINNHSALGIANGAFGNILFEAEKTQLPVPQANGKGDAGKVPENAPPPGSDDPMQLRKIVVKGPLKPGNVNLDDPANMKLCDERARKFGFRDFRDFTEKIADRCQQEGLDRGGHAIPVCTIAQALLSTDAASSVDNPTGTLKGAFDEFELLEADGTGAVKTGSLLVPKEDLDRNKLLAVGAALAKLVVSGRLEASQVYAYANSRTCDIYDTDAMAGAGRTCLNGLRDKLESSVLMKEVRAKIAQLRSEVGSGRSACLQKAERLERAVEAYCKRLDAIFPRDIIPTAHTWGLHKGKPLENETQYLEAQVNKLTDWLKETHSRPPDVRILQEAETDLQREMSRILGLKQADRPLGEGGLSKQNPITKFVTEDLCKQVKVLRNELKLAHELAGDAEVRKMQELSLTRFAQNHGGRLLPQHYTLEMGARGGILFGLSTGTNIGIGAGYNYKMTIDVDHAGKVTVLSVRGPKGEIAVSGGIGGMDATLNLSGGRMSGKALIYDNVQDFLKKSATDLRVRLHASGFFHFGFDLNVLSRKVDNASFAALLKESGVISKTDEFVPKPASASVTDEIFVRRTHITASGRLEGGSHVARSHADLKFEGVEQVKITSDPRFANVTKLEQMGKFQKLVCFVDRDAAEPHQIARSLAEEYADFCQAVRYDAWQKSSSLRKFLNRHTAQIEPPKMSLDEHLRMRLKNLADRKKVVPTDELKAAYLASLAATGAAVKLALSDEKESPVRDEALETLEKLQRNVLQPDFKISVEARRRWLYTSTVTDLGRTMTVGIEGAANVNHHMPVVNLLGADMLGGLAPGVVFFGNYHHRLSAEKTGLPHLDQDRIDFTIGTSGSQPERILTALLTSVLDKVGAKELLTTLGVTAGSPLIGPGLSMASNLALGKTGAPIDTGNRFKDTKIDLDAIFAKIGLHVGGDSGAGVRFQLVKTPEHGWKFESVQLVNYSNLSVDLKISAMAPLGPVGVGGYLAVNGGFGSTSVMGERLFGNSLMPFARVADEFKLNSSNPKETAWKAFLANNDAGLKELADNLKGYAETGVVDSEASAELVRYLSLVDGLKVRGKPHFGTQLKTYAAELAKATTPEGRRLAATGLFTTLARITAQQLKEHQPVKGGKNVKLSQEDLEAMQANDNLEQPLNVTVQANEWVIVSMPV